MSNEYRYQDHRPFVFTEDGSVAFVKLRDKVLALTRKTGCITRGKAMALACGSNGVGDTWSAMALVDRIVELGDLCLCPGTEGWMGQYQILYEPPAA